METGRSAPPVRDIALLFREYIHLERKRIGEGLSPLELQRWTALKRMLGKEFSPGLSDERANQRRSVRVSTRLAVTFRNLGELQRCLMTNLSRGGLFIATEQPAEIGTRLELQLHIEETGEQIDAPTEVVSVDVGPGFASGERGMGLRFLEMTPETQRAIDELYERKLEEAAEGVR
jgi:uncharacterized protein (TIGR02266 family)